MKVRFNLFTIILTLAGIPCSLKLTGCDRYESILEALRPYDKDTPDEFLRKLDNWFKSHKARIPSMIRKELKLLTAERSTEPCKYTAAILKFPAANPAGRFYTLLIGFCLDAYERQIDKQDKDHKKKNANISHRGRLLVLLRRLFVMDILLPVWNHSDRTIICFTKMAICVLYCRLKEKYPLRSFIIFPLTNPHYSMKTMLEASDLNKHTRKALMHLFEQLSGNKGDTAGEPSGSYLPESLQAEAMKNGSSGLSEILPQIIEMQQEYRSTAESLKTIMETKKNTPPPVGPPEDYLIGSREVMRILNISKSTLQRLREANKIPYCKIVGKIQYWYSDIIAYRDKHMGGAKDNNDK